MTTSAEHNHQELVDALRTVLAADATMGTRPGQLRVQLDAALGPAEAHRLRRQVHQVVAAAEDNLPVDLTRIAPLTSESLDRLSGELAAGRGWTTAAARSTLHTWASALGFEDLVASSWPRLPRPGLEVTQLPPGAGTPVGNAPGAIDDGAALRTAAAAWPDPHRRLRHVAHTLDGRAATTVVLAYAGMSLLLGVTLLVVLTVALVAAVLVAGNAAAPLTAVGLALAALVVRRLGYGALVAADHGLEFTPYDGALRKARPEKAWSVPWSDVVVREGLVSRLDAGGRSVQLGPRTRSFARAAAAMAGKGR